MRIIDVRDIDSVIESLRPKPDIKLRKSVETIISEVRKDKDKALKKYEKRFSGANLQSFRVTGAEVRDAYRRVSKDQVDAINLARRRLEKSERLIKNLMKGVVYSSEGVRIEKAFVPIDSVACYIPGGRARYPSTVVMSVVPAAVAGVKRIVAVSPSDDRGRVDSLTLVAADICGVDEFYKIGGAQAIAALAYGTRSIPRVDKIVGPGGMFVTMAKSILSDVVSIDMVAGPTELAVIADSSADPDLVAVDLISQAEHSSDTVCCLITNSKDLAEKVLKFIKRRIDSVPRSEIIRQSFRNNGFIAVCKTESQMVELANKLAPEHAEIMTRDPRRLAKKIKSAGLLLLGQNTPSSASDYLLGSNHVLPTKGFGKTRGSLGVLDYLKVKTTVESTKASLGAISRYMKAITYAEMLPNHYEAVRSRT